MIDKPDFCFFNPTKVYFGCDRLALLPELLLACGWRRIGVVIDHGLRTVPKVAQMLDTLRAAAIEPVVGWCTVSEPSYVFLDEFRDVFEGTDLQVVVGIGGGSALDTAKAIAVLVKNRAPAVSYRGFDKMTEPVLPIIAVPTTAGTGSEVTPNASFVDTIEKRKLGINGEAVRPRLAILDPELTLSCPVHPSVSAGVDALVHATEAFVAKKTNVMARFYAREGFRRVFNNLPRMVADPSDVAVRSELLYGAYLAGVALMHSGTGPAAAMSYPLGVLYGVPHGFGGATFLPYVADHNVSKGVTDYAELYTAMEGADIGLDRQVQARQFVQRIIAQWRQIGISDDLSALKIDWPEFVAQTLQLGGALEQNPTVFGSKEIEAVLRQLKVSAAP